MVDADGKFSRFPGDATDTRKFFREKSIGGVAQLPVWDTLIASDIPDLVVGGDLTGTVGNALVAKINGTPIGNDVFSQYLLLGGRAGATNNPTISNSGSGAQLTGSSVSGADFLIVATSGATKGLLKIQDELRLYSSTAAISAARYGARAVCSNNISGVSALFTPFAVSGTLTQTGATGQIMPVLDAAYTYQVNTSSIIPIFYLFNNRLLFSTGVANTSPSMNSLVHQPTFNVTGAGTLTNGADTAVYVAGTYNAGTGWGRTGLYYGDVVVSGGVTLASNIAVDVTDLVAGGISAAVRSAITPGANKYFLNDTGGANSVLTGNLTCGRYVAAVNFDSAPDNGYTVPTGQLARCFGGGALGAMRQNLVGAKPVVLQGTARLLGRDANQPANTYTSTIALDGERFFIFARQRKLKAVERYQLKGNSLLRGV